MAACCAHVLQKSGTPQVTFRGFTSTYSYIEIGEYNFVNFYLQFCVCACVFIFEGGAGGGIFSRV